MPIVAQKARQVPDQQRNEKHTAGYIDCQDNILQAIEVVGLLYGLCKQEQRSQCEADAGRRHQKIKRSL